MEGNVAAQNPFRFSSEYANDEMGLIYYNYRYLNPMDGRWIGRDPLQEEENENLYVFVFNNPLISFDRLGLSGFDIWEEGWDCQSARKQLEAQIRSWKANKLKLAAYFMEKFLDKNTPGEITVPDEYIKDMLKKSGNSLCEDLLPTRKISSSLRKVILLRWWKPLSCARFWKKELSTHPETHLLRLFHSLSAQGSFARITGRWSLFALFHVPVPQEM